MSPLRNVSSCKPGSKSGRRPSGSQLDSGDLRQPAREQAGLQRVGDLGSPTEHVVNAYGEGKLLAEFLDQAEVGDLEMTVPGLPGQRQDAIPALPVGDGHR